MENLTTAIEIAKEVIEGLTSEPKKISSKFFYDERGSEIFRDIMRMPEYYLTDSEAEVFKLHKQHLAKSFCDTCDHIDLVELGAGDGTKTRIILSHMYNNNYNFRYVPVDISEASNKKLVRRLNDEFPGMIIEEMTGDYFEMIGDLSARYSSRKILMLLGSNLGNYDVDESIDFLCKLSSLMTHNDKLFLGLDLKKEPTLIKQAYNDKAGHTRKFNLNLLERFNRELGTNFDVSRFEHAPSFDPQSGTAKSHLVSKVKQSVYFPDIDKVIQFDEGEAIHTEISQKYDIQLIELIAKHSGFQVEANYFDSKKYFVNTLWKKK
jgi:dimethylhistidine N-methyltransferase